MTEAPAHRIRARRLVAAAAACGALGAVSGSLCESRHLAWVLRECHQGMLGCAPLADTFWMCQYFPEDATAAWNARWVPVVRGLVLGTALAPWVALARAVLGRRRPRAFWHRVASPAASSLCLGVVGCCLLPALTVQGCPVPFAAAVCAALVAVGAATGEWTPCRTGEAGCSPSRLATFVRVAAAAVAASLILAYLALALGYAGELTAFLPRPPDVSPARLQALYASRPDPRPCW